MQAPAGRFSGFDPDTGAAAPALGAHTAAVLADLAGLGDQEIEQLRHKGVV
jgi:formyl-CoA transferase